MDGLKWVFAPDESGLAAVFEDWAKENGVKVSIGKQHGTGLYYIRVFGLDDVGREAWFTLSSPQPLDSAIQHAISYIETYIIK